jgi:acyl carrier protein
MKGKQIMNENEVKQGLKDFICENLGVDADALEFSTPLFEGTEIGLDSIDSIEIISYIDDTYQVSMTGVAKENFRSIDTIAAYIIANKK